MKLRKLEETDVDALLVIWKWRKKFSCEKTKILHLRARSSLRMSTFLLKHRRQCQKHSDTCFRMLNPYWWLLDRILEVLGPFSIKDECRIILNR